MQGTVLRWCWCLESRQAVCAHPSLSTIFRRSGHLVTIFRGDEREDVCRMLATHALSPKGVTSSSWVLCSAPPKYAR